MPTANMRTVDALAGASVISLAAGGAAWLADAHGLADGVWVSTTVIGLCYATVTLGTSLVRRELSVDLIAVLALAGALATGEPLAGALITLMLATGALLEARADASARSDLSRLASRAPTKVRLRRDDGMVEIPVDQARRGDRIVVAAGEVVPVDGRLLGPGTLDESALSGEPLPVDRATGEAVRSGVVVAGAAIEIVATAVAAESSYAAVVRLVERARASTAPFVRLADKLAIVFVPVTLAAAGIAWLWSGSAARAVAVLVVATPCPLLLAAPIAIMSGLSRAARGGVLVKGGSSLERLATGSTVLFDKTGTLTVGRPEVRSIVGAPATDLDELLRLAAGVEQVSRHVIANGIVLAARQRGLEVPLPGLVREEHGYGVAGEVDGHDVRLGKAEWIIGESEPGWASRARHRADLDDALCVFISVDGAPAGALVMDDPIRPDAPRLVRSLRQAGIDRIVLVTGDRTEVASTVGRIVGVDEVQAGCDPAAKLAVVERESGMQATIMVGDGVNDAPALAAAGAGVALAARGATASSEAADVVVVVERLDALADAIGIARRSRRIAWRAAVAGMGASAAAMGVAAIGLLPAAAGALLQELIDVMAMAIALTALVPPRGRMRPLAAVETATLVGQQIEHRLVLSVVDEIRAVADDLSVHRPDLGPARRLLSRLDSDLMLHERADEALLVPLAQKYLGSSESTAVLSRMHAEIESDVVRVRRLLDGMHDPADADDVVELRRLLYELHAVIRLHNALEDESTSALLA